VYRGFRGRQDSLTDSETGDDTLHGDRHRPSMSGTHALAESGPGVLSDYESGNLGSRRSGKYTGGGGIGGVGETALTGGGSGGRGSGGRGSGGRGSGGRDGRYKVSLSNVVEGAYRAICPCLKFVFEDAGGLC
jgi:hypothetical protein